VLKIEENIKYKCINACGASIVKYQEQISRRILTGSFCVGWLMLWFVSSCFIIELWQSISHSLFDVL
jgi:hypothetical protein